MCFRLLAVGYSGYLLSLMKYPIAPCDLVSLLPASIVLDVGATNHYEEAHPDGLADLDELALVGYSVERGQFEDVRIDRRINPREDCHIRLVHLWMNCMPSRTKSLGMSASSWKVSDMVVGVRKLKEG